MSGFSFRLAGTGYSWAAHLAAVLILICAIGVVALEAGSKLGFNGVEVIAVKSALPTAAGATS